MPTRQEGAINAPNPGVAPDATRLRWIVLLVALSALSGGAALGLQLTWTRRLGLIVGHEYPATLAVVTGFFAGLAIGAALVHRCLRRRSPIALLVLAECVVGAWALVTLPLLPWLDQALPGPARFLGAGLGLLPATIALGTTFPLMERALALLAGPADPARSRVATLYAINTLGAGLGVVGTVWIAMPALGLTGTTGVLAGIHCLNGVLFHRIQRSSPGNPGEAPMTASSKAPGDPPTDATHANWRRWAAGITGFLGLGYEVLGVRLLSQTLEGTVFTYALTLCVYLLGTTAGAGWVRWRANRHARTPDDAGLGWLAAIVASLGVGGVALHQSLMLYEGARGLLGDSPLAVVASELLVATGVFGLPSFSMGGYFSVLMAATASGRNGPASAIGWNLLGATLAPTAIGAGLFPWLGGGRTLLLIAGGYAGVWAMRDRRALVIVAGGGIALACPPSLDLQLPPTPGRIVALREGVSDTTAVIEPAPGQRTLRVNNRQTMGGTASAQAEQRHAHLPLLLHPAPRDALFLGIGTGISFAAMGQHPGLRSEGVEIVPEIIDLQGHFAPQNRPSAAQSLHVADARRWVRSTTNHYDVVVADLYHPARDGAGALYTREHFQAIRARLRPRGLFCQWLPLYQLDAPTLRCIVRTFVSVFPEADAFWLRPNADVPVLGLVGWMDPPSFPPGWWDRRVVDDALRGQLRAAGLGNDLQLLGLWWADAAWLRGWAGADGTTLNTDDHPRVVFLAPRATYARSTPAYALVQEFLSSGRDRPRRPTWVTSADREAGPGSFPRRLADYQMARDLYLEGLIAETSGRPGDSEDRFLASAGASADFTTGYAQILRRASLRISTDPAAARRLLEALARARPEVPVARQMLERLP